MIIAMILEKIKRTLKALEESSLPYQMITNRIKETNNLKEQCCSACSFTRLKYSITINIKEAYNILERDGDALISSYLLPSTNLRRIFLWYDFVYNKRKNVQQGQSALVLHDYGYDWCSYVKGQKLLRWWTSLPVSPPKN